MKVFAQFGALALLVLALPTNSWAAGITYDCDTAAGHFSELVLPASSSPFTVSGNVQLNSLATNKEYTAVARIQIATATAPGEAPKSYAGFAVAALPVDPKKSPTGSPAIQMLDWNASGKEDEAVPLSVMEKPGTVEHFSMTFDGKTVSVSLGKESRQFAVNLPEPVVRIVCSTGEFLITDLVVAPAR
jgi:hypothetical protein